jgi:hypothetical protein
MRETTEQKRLELRISELLLLVASLKTDLGRATSDATYYASEMNRHKNRNMQLAAAQQQRSGAVSKIESESMYKKEAGTCALYLERWHPDDRAEVCYRALYKSRGQEGERLTDHLSDLEGGFLDEVRRQHYHQRDEQIADHMRSVFSPALADVLRLSSEISWNVLRWWRDAWKFDWSATDKEGNKCKRRQMMAPDSNVPMPEPICIKLMRELEDAATTGSAQNVQHDDGRCAEVTSVDATALRALRSSEGSTMQGMATAGTLADPHWLTVTLDGAGLTHDDSGVRLALICASVERMNQSTHAVHTISFWRANEHAEHWSVVMARTKTVRPQLCRLFRDSLTRGAGELLNEDGSGSGVFVKLLFTADKPALCHVMGRRSFGHDFFSPFCRCSEKAGDLFNYTYDALTHYAGISFEDRCNLALVPLWEALGEPEPANWTITRKDKV